MGGAAADCGGGNHPAAAALTAVQLDAIGYLGGAVLAVCLIPQIAKIVWSRSARDISLAWNCLYIIGLALTMAYLILKNATAAWIPLVIETAGCLAIMGLKFYYEHTAAGRRASAAGRAAGGGGGGGGSFGRSLSRSASRVGAFMGGRYVVNAWRRRQQQQQQRAFGAADDGSGGAAAADDDSLANGAAASAATTRSAADVVIVDAEAKGAPIVVAIGGGETELAASRPQP